MGFSFKKITAEFNRQQINTVIIFPCIVLFAALIIRIQSGSPCMFYACYCYRGIFPNRFFYGLFYILRLALSGFMLGVAIVMPGFYRARLKAIIASLIGIVALLFEYRLLFFYESFLLVILILALSGFFCFKAAMNDEYLCCKRKDWACICVAFAILQIILAIMVLSLII